jgi:hypothetical protein
MFTTRRALLTLAAALACTAFAAHAAETVYTARLDGAQNLPEPVNTKATGQLELRPSADGKRIAYKISVTGLVNAVAADLHLGPASANGPLVLKLFPQEGQAAKQGEFTGVLAEGTVTAADLIGPLTGAELAELIEALAEGNVYSNVHTSDRADPPNSGPGDYRLGEIRGQLK